MKKTGIDFMLNAGYVTLFCFDIELLQNLHHAVH